MIQKLDSRADSGSFDASIVSVSIFSALIVSASNFLLERLSFLFVFYLYKLPICWL